MTLTKEEKEELERQMLQELEDEEKKLSELREKKKREHHTHNATKPIGDAGEKETILTKEDEISQLKNELAEHFYTNKGYKKYIDHAGRTKWLTPEEYEKRIARRKRGEQKNMQSPLFYNKLKIILIYISVALIGIIIGRYLSMRH